MMIHPEEQQRGGVEVVVGGGMYLSQIIKYICLEIIFNDFNDPKNDDPP